MIKWTTRTNIDSLFRYGVNMVNCSCRHRERCQAKKKLQEEKVAAAKRAANAESARKYGRKIKEKANALPSTPRSKGKLIQDWIENASPHSTQVYHSLNLKKSPERQAESDIADATSALAKSSKNIRQELLPELGRSNKSAVSRRLGISRKSFYYKSQ